MHLQHIIFFGSFASGLSVYMVKDGVTRNITDVETDYPRALVSPQKFYFKTSQSNEEFLSEIAKFLAQTAFPTSVSLTFYPQSTSDSTLSLSTSLAPTTTEAVHQKDVDASSSSKSSASSTAAPSISVAAAAAVAAVALSSSTVNTTDMESSSKTESQTSSGPTTDTTSAVASLQSVEEIAKFDGTLSTLYTSESFRVDAPETQEPSNGTKPFVEQQIALGNGSSSFIGGASTSKASMLALAVLSFIAMIC